MTGTVSDILSFSLNDGPGIRTTVFMKGCPLHCLWCHNPENSRSAPQVMRIKHLCVSCSACAAVCPAGARNTDGTWKTDGTACLGCGKCAEICPTGANRLYGTLMTPEETADRVYRDAPFFRDTGGVTFSGGEPLYRAEFVRECARILGEKGIRAAVETSLYAREDTVADLLPYISLWLCDWKVTDPDLHRKLTGVSNEQILSNLRFLNKNGARIRLRCPVIPDCNDTGAPFEYIGRLTYELEHIEQVNLLPYHNIGNDKREKLGLRPDGFTVPGEEAKREWLKKLEKLCRCPVKL